MPSALAVAKCFFDLAKAKGESTPKFVKIQKLVYFAHVFYLGMHDKPLIEEQLEAWQWGPIFPSLYHCFMGQDIAEVMRQAPTVQDSEAKEMIESVGKVLLPMSTMNLSLIAHSEESPWYKTVTAATESTDTSVEFLRLKLPPGLVIERELIRQFYESLRGAGAAHGRHPG